MKKLIFTFFVIFSAYGLTIAQTSQGNILLGGTFRIASTTEEQPGDDVKSSSFTLAPSAGYFVSDNFAIGLGLEIVSGKVNDGTGDDKFSEFNFGPFARYYKFSSNENFAFFGEAGFGIGSGTYKPNGGGNIKSSSFDFYISPGFSYFFNEKWALELQLQGIRYRSIDPNKDGDNDKTSSFTFGASSLNPSLGFRYFIGN